MIPFAPLTDWNDAIETFLLNRMSDLERYYEAYTRDYTIASSSDVSASRGARRRAHPKWTGVHHVSVRSLSIFSRDFV